MKCPFCNKFNSRTIEEFYKEKLGRTYKSGELIYCKECDKIFEVKYDSHGLVKGVA